MRRTCLLTNIFMGCMYNGHAFFRAANGHLRAKDCLTIRQVKAVNVRFRPLNRKSAQMPFLLRHLVSDASGEWTSQLVVGLESM